MSKAAISLIHVGDFVKRETDALHDAADDFRKRQL